MVAVAAPVSAQSIVSGAYYHIDGWDIIPLLDGDTADPSTQSVHSLMLFRADAPIAPENITAVWARRTASGWEADAWAGDSRADVTMWMVNNTALPAPVSVADDWPLHGLAAEYTVAVEADDPKPLGAGLPLGHPLEPAAGIVPDPSSVLDPLESLDEPAASSSVTTPGASGTAGSSFFDIGCPFNEGLYVNADGDPITTETIWDAVANSIDSDLQTPGAMAQTFDDTLNLAAGCCIPDSNYRSGPLPAGPWVCEDTWNPPSVDDTACVRAVSWTRTCSRTIRRWRQTLSFFCRFRTVYDSATESFTETCTVFYDGVAAGCPDTGLPNYTEPQPSTPPGSAFCTDGASQQTPWQQDP